jgi:hypothetical protein
VDVMAIFKLRIRTKGDLRCQMRHAMPATSATDHAIVRPAYNFPACCQRGVQACNVVVRMEHTKIVPVDQRAPIPTQRIDLHDSERLSCL